MPRSLLGFLVKVMSPVMLRCDGIRKKGIRGKARIFYADCQLVIHLFLLQHKEDGGWESQGHTEIKGVKFAGGQRTVTHGIWMWLYPNRINGV